MNPFCTSLGTPLSPTAPSGGLAGLPIMRSPQGLSAFLVQMPKSFPRQRGLGAQTIAAHEMTLHRPATTIGGRPLYRAPVSTPQAVSPVSTWMPRQTRPRRPRSGGSSTSGYQSPAAAQSQASQMPDEPDFTPFSTALEQAAELGLITPSQVSQYQAQAEQSNLGQLQALTAQLNTLIASSPTAGISFFPSRRRGMGTFSQAARHGRWQRHGRKGWRGYHFSGSGGGSSGSHCGGGWRL